MPASQCGMAQEGCLYDADCVDGELVCFIALTYIKIQPPLQDTSVRSTWPGPTVRTTTSVRTSGQQCRTMFSLTVGRTVTVRIQWGPLSASATRAFNTSHLIQGVWM